MNDHLNSINESLRVILENGLQRKFGEPLDVSFEKTVWDWQVVPTDWKVVPTDMQFFVNGEPLVVGEDKPADRQHMYDMQWWSPERSEWENSLAMKIMGMGFEKVQVRVDQKGISDSDVLTVTARALYKGERAVSKLEVHKDQVFTAQTANMIAAEFSNLLESKNCTPNATWTAEKRDVETHYDHCANVADGLYRQALTVNDARRYLGLPTLAGGDVTADKAMKDQNLKDFVHEFLKKHGYDLETDEKEPDVYTSYCNACGGYDGTHRIGCPKKFSK